MMCFSFAVGFLCILCFLYFRLLIIFFIFFFFFFNDTATTEIYTLSLHDALPICGPYRTRTCHPLIANEVLYQMRSEEHTSELQSHHDLVCRLLLEKKKNKYTKQKKHKKKLKTKKKKNYKKKR